MQKKEAIKKIDTNNPNFLKVQRELDEKYWFDPSAYSYAIKEYKLKIIELIKITEQELLEQIVNKIVDDVILGEGHTNAHAYEYFKQIIREPEYE
ncbi:MAG: hypothetical protein IJE89_01215 [Bacilli bacterium]|nr:hypothetical protein [Bacilli bacterium]